MNIKKAIIGFALVLVLGLSITSGALPLVARGVVRAADWPILKHLVRALR